MSTNEIVVGVDGSAPARTALRWAAAEAARRSAPLRVVAAYDLQWSMEEYAYADRLATEARQGYEAIVAEAVAEVAQVSPGISVTGAAIEGDPVTVLLDAARDAAMTVLGNRGHGGFTSLLLGSVSQRVATHATGPVVVVRGRGDTADGPIIVGADGSSASEHALEVAFDEARRRGCAVVAIRAYTVPVQAWGVLAPPVTYDLDSIPKAAATQLEALVKPWRDKYPGVALETVLGHGSAGKLLTDASVNAGLVVVGSRGHGSVAGTLLGSVGLQLLHHADCPVMIVR